MGISIGLALLTVLCPQQEKVTWARDYDRALAAARAVGKPVLVHLLEPVGGVKLDTLGGVPSPTAGILGGG